MSRARRARRVAAAAVFGGGGLTATMAAGYGLLLAEARLARRWIGQPFNDSAPDASGVYGDGPGRPLVMGMIGDSSAVGLGADDVRRTPGAVIAAGLAALAGRPVQLHVVAVVGAESHELAPQVEALLARARPDVCVIMVGANDVTHRIRASESVRHLGATVRALREAGSQVVVGTCPDLGTIEPIAQPLRWVARRLSRELAAAQTIATVEAGGRSVSLGDLLGPEFSSRPEEMFSADRFHPSAAGYSRAAAALLPSVCSALELWPDGRPAPDLRRGEGVDDVANAAARAASVSGTEVAGVSVAGSERGPRGRWAFLTRRVRLPAGSIGADAASRLSTDRPAAAAAPELEEEPCPKPSSSPPDAPPSDERSRAR